MLTPLFYSKITGLPEGHFLFPPSTPPPNFKKSVRNTHVPQLNSHPFNYA